MRATSRNKIDRAVKALQDAAEYVDANEPSGDLLARDLVELGDQVREAESMYLQDLDETVAA